MSEWANFTEVVLKLGAMEAYLDFYKDVKFLHKLKSSEVSEGDFRKKVILFASKRASYEEQFLLNRKRRGFHDYFELAKGRLERKEAEEDLEKIIQKWYNKLKKET